MWAFSLGSGTSGGVLAPLLMIGGALGEIAAHYAHATAEQQALWAAVGMGAMLSGSLGVPLTATVFCLEITRSSACRAAGDAGMHRCVHDDLAHHAAVNPDGEARPPRHASDA